MFRQIRKWINKFSSTRRFQPHFSVQLTNDGFTFNDLHHRRKSEYILWEDIHEVTAYKRDLYTYDTICVGITYRDNNFVEIGEEDTGYADFLDAAARSLPEIRTDWLDGVAHPPFARNETVLYRKT